MRINSDLQLASHYSIASKCKQFYGAPLVPLQKIFFLSSGHQIIVVVDLCAKFEVRGPYSSGDIAHYVLQYKAFTYLYTSLEAGKWRS